MICEYGQKDTQSATGSPSAKRQKIQGTATSSTRSGLAQFPSIAGTSPTESSVLLNPPMAEDVEILEHYLTAHGPGSSTSGKPYSLISKAPEKPIVYLTVPRRRKGLSTETNAGAKQREVMEAVLGRLKTDVVNLYVCMRLYAMLQTDHEQILQ